MGRPAQTHCKRGHAYGPGDQQTHRGVRSHRCQRCAALMRQARRDAQYPAASLVPAVAPLVYRAQRSWSVRRARYGAHGMPDASYQRFVAGAAERLRRRGHHNTRKTHCQRGHALTPDNVWRNGRNTRVCKICRALSISLRKTGRPEWVSIHDQMVTVNIKVHDAYYRVQHDKLREQMIAAHPDKGRHRSSAPFIRAKKQFDTFLAAEQRWYAATGWPPPTPLRQAA